MRAILDRFQTISRTASVPWLVMIVLSSGPASARAASDDVFALIDPTSVTFFDLDGERVGEPWPTVGSAEVITTRDGFLIVDDREISLFDRAGSLVSRHGTHRRARVQWAPTGVIVDDGRPRVIAQQAGEDAGLDDISGEIGGHQEERAVPDTIVGGHVVRSHHGEVRIHSRGGKESEPVIQTRGFALVLPFGGSGRFAVADVGRVRIFDLEGHQCGDAIVSHPLDQQPGIRVQGSRLLVVDRRHLRSYDADGTRHGPIIALGEGPRVFGDGSTLAIVDSGHVRFFDTDLSQLGRTVVTWPLDVTPGLLIANRRFVVLDSSTVSIYDSRGELQNHIGVRGRVRLDILDRETLIIEDQGRVRLFDLNLEPRGRAIRTTWGSGSVNVQILGKQVFVKDGRSIRLFDRNGKRLGMPVLIADPDARVILSPDRRSLAVVERGLARIFDDDLVQQGQAILTRPRDLFPGFHFVGYYLVVIDTWQIRVFDRSGELQEKPIPRLPESIACVVGNRLLVVDRSGVRLFSERGLEIMRDSSRSDFRVATLEEVERFAFPWLSR